MYLGFWTVIFSQASDIFFVYEGKQPIYLQHSGGKKKKNIPYPDSHSVFHFQESIQ